MKYILTLLLLLFINSTQAGGVYQTQESFLAEVFSKNVPKPEVIWPDKTLKKKIANILGHKYKSLREIGRASCRERV